MACDAAPGGGGRVLSLLAAVLVGPDPAAQAEALRELEVGRELLLAVQT